MRCAQEYPKFLDGMQVTWPESPQVHHLPQQLRARCTRGRARALHGQTDAPRTDRRTRGK